MAHFAELDENNVVKQVLVVSNEDLQNLEFPESESVGIAFLTNLLPGTRWVQTSYNGSFRMRYAGIGYSFVPTTAATPYGGFANPKWYSSWIWNDQICDWEAPIPYPTDGKIYMWDEENQRWYSAFLPSNPVTVIG